MLEINKIYNGDCLEVIKDIDDKSIDMILCDLPYGTTACKWDTIIPFEPLWEQYKRIIKDNGAIVLTASQPFTSSLVVSCIELFKYQWVWKKNNPTGFLLVKTQPMKEHEDVLVFSKGTIASGSNRNMKYFPQGLIKSGINKVVANKPKYIGARPNQYGKKYIQEFTNYPRSILEFSREGKTVHPTQKPVALFEYLIKTYTNEGDIVLDNCAGSGTTGVACINTSRNYILIEKDKKYCEIAKQRIEETLCKTK